MTAAVFVFIIFITISFAFLVELEDVEYNKQAIGNSLQSAPSLKRRRSYGRSDIVPKYEAVLQKQNLLITAFAHGIWRLRITKQGPTRFEVPDDVLDPLVSTVPIAVNTTPAGCQLTAVGPEVHSVLHVPCATGDATLPGESLRLSSVGLEQMSIHLCDPYPCLQTVFLRSESLHGIPERTMPFSLPDGSYRLYNRDIQYPLNNPQGIYGAIPFLMGHGGQPATAGVLWFNAADSTVRLTTMGERTGRMAEWRAVGGVVDLFIFPGPAPGDVTRQMAWVTGPVALPPLFALGYHQCRWSYTSQRDALAVDAGFDQHRIPYDVLWLDIDHTRGNRYFTWDRMHFPDPKAMQAELAAKGRHLVCITDPHIKRDPGWRVFREASAGSFFILDAQRKEFEGWCWPGQSSWVDFYDPAARAWYAKQFAYDHWEASTPILHAWIDMNEPSVFNHFEGTVPADALHHNGFPHAHQHNLYGFYHAVAAYAGLLERNVGDLSSDRTKLTRPFVLTRSFFAGSQRYAAAWTGDNRAEWGYLAASVPMLLSLSVAGMPFVGADVGGFFDNPEPELLVRWYQLGAVYPFYRGHSHQESRRREPWLFGNETTAQIRASIELRYRLLPYLYTAFRLASLDGGPILAPLTVLWPSHDPEEGQFMVGAALMAKPVLVAGVTRVSMALPGAAEVWFDFHRRVAYDTPTVSVAAPLAGLLPLLQRAGTIVPLWSAVPASTGQAADQPRAHTLQIALDAQGCAAGSLYVDDGLTFGHTAGRYLHRLLRWDGGRLTCRPLGKPAAIPPELRDALGVDPRYARDVPAEDTAEAGIYTKAYVDRIVILGLRSPPTSLVGTLRTQQPPGAGDPEAVRTVPLLWQEGRLSADRLHLPLLPSWSFGLGG